MNKVWLWLDDERTPPLHADCGIVWTWVKNADDAIKLLESGDVVFCSLDHDLADEHYQAFFKSQSTGIPLDTNNCKEKTGYTVLCWIEENNAWPSEGIRIHTMNTVRGPIMKEIVFNHYGKNFQYVYAKKED